VKSRTELSDHTFTRAPQGLQDKAELRLSDEHSPEFDRHA